MAERGGAVIEVAEALLDSSASAATTAGPGVVKLNTAQLILQDVAVDLQPSTAVSSPPASCFALVGSSQLELDSCTVTVRDSTPDSQNPLCLIVCNPSAEDRIPRAPMLASKKPSSPFGLGNSVREGMLSRSLDGVSENGIVIRSTRSVFRGDANLIQLNFTPQMLDDRADISFSNTLVALSGSVLDLRAPTSEEPTQRFVRLLCDQSTMATEKSFAQLNFDGSQIPTVGLMRSSQSSIYWSPSEVPHVTVRGARRQSLLGNFNLLLLQGVSNLYDANIQELCHAFLGGERIATFGFAEASASGWLAERASESRVRWQDARFLSEPWSEIAPSDFAVTDVLFTPGISASNLPSGGFK